MSQGESRMEQYVVKFRNAAALLRTLSETDPLSDKRLCEIFVRSVRHSLVQYMSLTEGADVEETFADAERAARKEDLFRTGTSCPSGITTETPR